MSTIDQILIGGFVLLVLFVLVKIVFARYRANKDYLKINGLKIKKEVEEKVVSDDSFKEATNEYGNNRKRKQPSKAPVEKEDINEKKPPKREAKYPPSSSSVEKKIKKETVNWTDKEIAADPVAVIKDLDCPTDIRIKAIEHAGEKRLKEAVPALLEAMYEPEPSIAVAAADSLVTIGDERAIEPMIEITRRADEELMQQIAPEESKDDGQKALPNDTAIPPYSMINNIRFMIDKLPKEYFLPDGTTIPRAELVLKGLQDKDEVMRQMAAKAAIGLDSEDIIEPLAKALEDPDETESVRYMAAEALGGMDDDRTVDSLLRALNDSNVAVRYSAAAALNGRKDPRVVEALIEAMNDSDPYVKSSVAYALGTTQDEWALEALFEGLMDECEIVKFSCLKSLVNFEPDDVLKKALDELKNSDKQVRLAMLDVLGQINSNKSIDVLREHLDAKDSDIRYRASMALMGQQSIEVMDELVEASKRFDEELVKLSESANVDTRLVSAVTNAKTGFSKDLGHAFRDIDKIDNLTQDLEVFRKKLMSPDSDTRAMAAKQLADKPSPDAVELLACAAKDENEFVRSFAVTSLGIIKDYGAFNLLFTCESDESEEVRYTLVKTMHRFEEPEAYSLLERLRQNDPSRVVRRAARKALEGV